MAAFLIHLYEELLLIDKGITVESSERGQFLCRAVLLTGSCDLPARCLVCNSLQFNGEYGCWKCLQQGRTEKVGIRGHTKIFPYIRDNLKGPLRNKQDTIKHSYEALTNLQSGQKQYAVKGVKGPSWLLFLENLDIVAGMGIDYMHRVLLGVQKLLLWFATPIPKSPSVFGT